MTDTEVFMPFCCVSSFPDGIRRRFSGLTREQAFSALLAYADAGHGGDYGPWSWVTDENYINGEYYKLIPPPPVIDPPFPVLDLTDCKTEEERRKALQDPFDPDGAPVPDVPSKAPSMQVSKTNLDVLRQLSPYELSMVFNNIHEHLCDICPRDKENRCNDDCNNGLTEWLCAEFDPSSPAWEEN